jgi:hypothetical protein
MQTIVTLDISSGRDCLRDYLQSLHQLDDVGNIGCGHSSRYFLNWNDYFCGLCFFRDGYSDELPRRMHLVRTLASNGNPEQDAKLMSHIRVIEGFERPEPGVPLHLYRLARERLYGRSNRTLFPFASTLWDLMGYQPPIAEPLIMAVHGKRESEIATAMNCSLWDTVGRLEKGIQAAARIIRKNKNA